MSLEKKKVHCLYMLKKEKMLFKKTGLGMLLKDILRELFEIDRNYNYIKL